MNKSIVFIPVIGMLSACGATDTSSTEGSTSIAVTLEAELPECDEDRLGQLAYIEATLEFRVCKSDGWQAISIKGEKGDIGATGAVGPTGPAGTGLTISSSFSCSKVAGGFLFTYRGTIFSTGDLFVYCEVSSSALQSSAAVLYQSTQTGATTGTCIITFDSEPPASAGYWAFTMNGGKKAVYTDSGASIDGATETFETSDCQTY